MLGGEPPLGVLQHVGREPEPLGNGERLALAGQARGQPIGRPQGGDVELD